MINKIFILGLLPESKYCNRSSLLLGLQNSLEDGINYCRIWNTINHYSIKDSYILDSAQLVKNLVITHINNNVATNPSGDGDYCYPTNETDTKFIPCEGSSDVFFMIDIRGDLDEQAAFVTELVRYLDLRRNGGSVTVLTNTQSNESFPELFDDYNLPIKVPFSALAYNTTSSQRASCSFLA